MRSGLVKSRVVCIKKEGGIVLRVYHSYIIAPFPVVYIRFSRVQLA